MTHKCREMSNNGILIPPLGVHKMITELQWNVKARINSVSNIATEYNLVFNYCYNPVL